MRKARTTHEPLCPLCAPAESHLAGNEDVGNGDLDRQCGTVVDRAAERMRKLTRRYTGRQLGEPTRST